MAATKREWYITGDDDRAYVFDTHWEAQTFTVGNTGIDENFDITSVKVLGYRVGLPATLYFAIKAVDGEEEPTGEDLSTGSVDPSGWTTDTAGAWYEISMSAYTLQASTQYALVLRSPDSDGAAHPCCRVDLVGTYTGGERLYSDNGGTDWTASAAFDTLFEIWGDVAPLTVLAETLELAAELHAPTIVIDCTVLAETLELALTLQAPSVFPIVTVSPESLALAVALLSPVASVNITVTPDMFALALTQYAPVVSMEVIVFPVVLELEAALHAPETISRFTAIPPFMQKDLIDPFSGGAWLWLAEIAVPGYKTQNIVRNTVDVRHAGKDYNKWNLDLSKQTFAGDGSIPRVTLRVAQDPAHTFEKIVNASKGCHDGTVKLIRVNEKFLDYRVTALEADYDILVADSDWEWVYFTLGIPNLLTQRIPLRVGSSKICPWAVPEYFKGVRCRYTGSDVSCTGKLSDCYAKGNAQHWGGEVGLDPNVTRV